MADLIWYLDLGTAYTTTNDHIVSIYGGRYTSSLLTKSQKCFSTIRYGVRNPVKAGLSATPKLYRWSGHASVLHYESIIIKSSIKSLITFFIKIIIKPIIQ